MYKVIILMGTYNGERFIAEQLDSILAQTYQNWELIIRDDQSKDQTIVIIQEYMRKDSRIKLIQGFSNVGQVRNFEELLKEETGKHYVMFSDQDDVWKKNKIEKTLITMLNTEQNNPNVPVLVYTDKTFVNQNLKPMGIPDKDLKHDLFSILCQNPVYGCTAMLNWQLKELIIPFPEYVVCHDYWSALVASSKGVVVHIRYESIYYRQHDGNVTGGVNNFSLKAKIKNWKKTNNNIKKAIIQNYMYCKTISENNCIAQKYNRIMEKTRLYRGIYAMLHGYKLDNPIATMRALLVLGITKFDFKNT